MSSTTTSSPFIVPPDPSGRSGHAAFRIFDGITPEVAAALLAGLPRRTLAVGEIPLREGDSNRTLLLIETGELAVWKGPPGTSRGVRVHQLKAGDCVGEISALNGAPASATLVALTPVTLCVLDPLAITDVAAREQVVANLARTLADRLTQTTDEVKARHEAQLQSLRVQVSAAVFAARTLLLVSLYTLCLPVFALIRPHLPADAVYSCAVIVVFAAVAWYFLARNSTGYADYGFTLKNWGRQLWRGTMWTLPLLALATLVKYLATLRWPGQFTLFEPWRSLDDQVFVFGEWATYATAYVVLVLAQEIIRCTIQRSLAIFYQSSRTRDKWRSILAANAAFAALHVHLGLIFPMLAFVPGFFWAWVYQREHSYLAVCASHALLGGWVLFALGVPY